MVRSLVWRRGDVLMNTIFIHSCSLSSTNYSASAPATATALTAGDVLEVGGGIKIARGGWRDYLRI